MTDPAVAGLMLAGGRSRRMGGDKMALPFGGESLLQRALRRLAPQVGALAVSANDPLPLPPGYRVLPDAMPGRPGPLAGTAAGLAWAATLPGVTHLVTAAGDTPFFPDDLVARLAAAAASGRVVVAASRGRQHPVFALWPVDRAARLDAFLRSGRKPRVADAIAEIGGATVEFADVIVGAVAVDPFFNVNTPADLDAARRILSERSG